MVGHLDYEARILDGALRTEASNFDVGQAGETVTVSDLSSLTVAPVNVTKVALGSPTALPSGSVAMQGGDVLGVLNATDGTLWTTSATTPSPANLSDNAAVASNMGASASALSHRTPKTCLRVTLLVAMSAPSKPELEDLFSPLLTI